MKKFGNGMKKVLAAALCGALILAVPGLPAVAAGPNMPKEETVYVSLDARGGVKEVDVVNSFDLDSPGTIVDYGSYAAVRNMTSTDAISVSGDAVTVEAGAGRLSYEGRLDDAEIPWKIAVSYFMDGKEYAPEDIGGMSGALRIHLSIQENGGCAGDFFDGYALQATLLLDNLRCRNIVAEGATVANNGGDKQISYTVLPGRGLEADITADATDFETEGFSINGVVLSLDLGAAGTDGLDDSVSALTEGADALDEGAGELKDGLDALESGATALADGAGQLRSGADAVKQGADALSAGIGSMSRGLEELESQTETLRGGSAAFKAALNQLKTQLDAMTVTSEDLSALASASSAIKSGADSLAQGLSSLEAGVSYAAFKSAMAAQGLDVDQLKQNNTAAAAALQSLAEALNGQIAAVKAAGGDASALEAQARQLQSASALLTADNAALGGAESYLGQVNGSIDALLGGAVELQNGCAALDGNIQTLVNAMGSLAYSMSGLGSAVGTLAEEYEKLDAGIVAYTGGVGQILGGFDAVSEGAAQLLSGAKDLSAGAGSLYGKTGDLAAGVKELSGGAGELKEGTEALRDGVSAASGLDSLLDALGGEKGETESFVSDKNSRVESVQFVMRTQGVSAPEEEPPAAPEPAPLNLWQKLLKLFGLYDG